MIVRVTDDVSVSVPTGIENWTKESEDNMVEFKAMLNSLVTSISDALSKKIKASLPTEEKSPYQELYEEQLREVEALGISKENFDKFIYSLVKNKPTLDRNTSSLTSKDISDFLKLFE